MVEKRSTSHGCMAQEPTSLQDSCPSCKRMTDKQCMPRRKYFMQIVPRNCALPPAHIGLDLVYSGITKMARKWSKNGEKWKNCLENPFFTMFCPCPAGGSFPFGFAIFSPISGFWPSSMPYQPGMIPKFALNRRRQTLFCSEFCIADADTAVLCSLERATWQIKMTLDIIFI